MKNTEEMRESCRKRVAKFHEKQKATGRKQISGFISESATEILDGIKSETGENTGQVFERLLLDSDSVNINTDNKQRIERIERLIRQREEGRGENDPAYARGLTDGYVAAYKSIIEYIKDGML